MKTKRDRSTSWQRLRAHLLRENPLCVACQRTGRVTAATELDHIVPLHQGGTDDVRNLQGLCAECHRIKTTRERGATARVAFDVQGNPITDGHHWR